MIALIRRRLAESAPGAPGGLNALRDLGVDCVELLPVTAFPLLEPAPKDGGHINPTGRNHWGYMPSFFFAPTERYSLRGADPQPGVCGRCCANAAPPRGRQRS